MKNRKMRENNEFPSEEGSVREGGDGKDAGTGFGGNRFEGMQDKRETRYRGYLHRIILPMSMLRCNLHTRKSVYIKRQRCLLLHSDMCFCSPCIMTNVMQL